MGKLVQLWKALLHCVSSSLCWLLFSANYLLPNNREVVFFTFHLSPTLLVSLDFFIFTFPNLSFLVCICYSCSSSSCLCLLLSAFFLFLLSASLSLPLHRVLVKDQNSQSCLIGYSNLSDAETGVLNISQGGWGGCRWRIRGLYGDILWFYLQQFCISAAVPVCRHIFFSHSRVTVPLFKSVFPLNANHWTSCCCLSLRILQSYLLLCLHSSTGQHAVLNLNLSP